MEVITIEQIKYEYDQSPNTVQQYQHLGVIRFLRELRIGSIVKYNEVECVVVGVRNAKVKLCVVNDDTTIDVSLDDVEVIG